MNHLPILLELELRHIEQTRQREADALRRGYLPRQTDDVQVQSTGRLAARQASRPAPLGLSWVQTGEGLRMRWSKVTEPSRRPDPA